jgi:hypothetical protein
LDFLDEEESAEHQRPARAARRRQPRRQGRGGPPPREVLVRRAAALGVGLLILILLALAVRGCLNAREDRATRDYVRDLSSIINETNQTSATFFERLANRGTLSVTEFVDEVNADRSAVDNYRSRIDSLDAPGDMAAAQSALSDVYEMRAAAMNTIAEQMRTALGDQGREKAVERIARQMSVLYASDFMYSSLAQTRINKVLETRGISDVEAPASQFVPDGTKWLDANQVGSALGVSGGSAGEADDDLTHGTGLVSVSVAGVELQPDATNVVTVEGTPELTVQVQNQGQAEESDLTVTVTVGDGSPLTDTITSIAAGTTESVTIPLTPTPSGATTIKVDVAAVPGEQFLENNTATYEVDFG